MSGNRCRLGNRCAGSLCALLVTSLFAVSSQAAHETVPGNVTFRSGGHQRYYCLIVPTSLSDQVPAPILLLLHGSYSSPLDMIPAWTNLAEREGLILAAPKSLAEYGWRIHEDGPELMRDVIDDVASKHPVDRRRLYVFGHSAGAVHALTLGLLESQYFAAVALHAGAWTDRSSFKVVPLARRKIPLWIVIGDRDEQFPMPAVRATEAALRDGGLSVTLTIMKGHDHSYRDVAPQVNEEAWTFLRAVELDQPPMFQPYR